jgi:electron transfer flavoprotein alpha subunit
MAARVLVIGESAGDRLSASTAKCVACAREIAPDVEVAVFAARAAPVAGAAAALAGVARVLHVEWPAPPLAVAFAPEIARLAAGFTHVLGPSSTFGKDLMPRVAALLGVGQISDVMRVLDAQRFQRPIYAGNAIATVRAPAGRTVVATVRLASYAAGAAAREPAPIEARSPGGAPPSHTRFVELRSERADRPDLQTATRVVAGGRALGSAENFARLYELADALGAAVGASRAAVDSGFVPNELQVGQTGKIIAPELYLAIGISGAIQHLTGIKDARTIVAVNRDPDAPIFEVADVGLVADWASAVPELLAALRAAPR